MTDLAVSLAPDARPGADWCAMGIETPTGVPRVRPNPRADDYIEVRVRRRLQALIGTGLPLLVGVFLGGPLAFVLMLPGLIFAGWAVLHYVYCPRVALDSWVRGFDNGSISARNEHDGATTAPD